MKLGQQFIEIIEEQLASNEPVFVRLTLERLKKEGYAEDHAKQLIATCVASEMFELLQENREFDEENYMKKLNQLPAIPS